MVIGACAVVVVALGIWAVNSGGTDKPAKPQVPSKRPPPSEAVADRDPAVHVPAIKTSGRAGKTPDVPAPQIKEADLQRADQCYEEAKKLDLQARKAQKIGDHGAFNRLINDAWDKLEEVGPLLKPYDEWFEEADLGDWAIPASYLRYQKRIAKIDRLRGRIRRIRPMRRN